METMVSRSREGMAATIARGRDGAMTKIITLSFALLAFALLPACMKDTPAADGRYATFDHGNNNRP
jgi:hypothetical protein